MGASIRKLFDEQRAELLQAFSLRDSDFLEACARVLSMEDCPSKAALAGLYEQLVRGEINKVQALEVILDRLGYRALSAPRSDILRYDLDHLLSFAPGSDERFVSMMIDFAANRSPTPDEALQFGQSLGTGRQDRREVAAQILQRYSDRFIIDDGDVLVRFVPAQGHMLCQAWGNHLVFHPELKLHTSLTDGRCSVLAKQGGVLDCDLILEEEALWVLSYEILQSTCLQIRIEVQDLDNGAVICGAESGQDLIGQQRFKLAQHPQSVRVSLMIVSEECDVLSAIEPMRILLTPEGA